MCVSSHAVPKVGTFAQEARRYAMELKHPTLKQPPPIEEEIDSKEKKESSEERATPDFTGDCMQMLLVCGIYCVSWFRL